MSTVLLGGREYELLDADPLFQEMTPTMGGEYVSLWVDQLQQVKALGERHPNCVVGTKRHSYYERGVHANRVNRKNYVVLFEDGEPLYRMLETGFNKLFLHQDYRVTDAVVRARKLQALLAC